MIWGNSSAYGGFSQEALVAGLSKCVERLVRELDRQTIGSGSQRFIAYLLRHDRGQPGPTVFTLSAAKAQIAS